MNKFWCILISRNLNVQKAWISLDEILSLLTQNDLNEESVFKVYRTGTDQYAQVVDKSIVWVDVQEYKKPEVA